MQNIYFYAPNEIDRKVIQEDHTQWTGYHSNFMAWIAQSYFYLKQAGLPCQITEQIPDEGILIADRNTLAEDYPFLDRVMLICAKSDQEYHPSAHIHIVYNFFNWYRDRNTIRNPYLLNHWPIPGLISRNKERLSTVENIAYIGTKSQLVPELNSKTWTDALTSLGCNWSPVWDRTQWNNYSQLDVIVAIRRFEPQAYLNKGPLKLINAWLAGVPIIVNSESGILAHQRNDLDFIIVNSLEEAIQAVEQLKNHPELYHEMIANGFERVKEYTLQPTLKQWLDFFKNIVYPTYEEWKKLSKTQKRILFIRRYFDFRYHRAKARLTKQDYEIGTLKEFLEIQKQYQLAKS
ncbi:glycosyltransferase [Chroococcus sp. FPU101]|uniref:glycosyltransferase n=1 Tax=Chroococcus sp. FPU101 TaxID=1974212 RepID=UPI001A8D3DCF|nr:glycosyltransferase [Chroococcus sp. FPU101]GFE71500.1 hypothetical protein CFPU101_41100 [Chroococcus sp. FPU101]